jgi:hypothetical protein
METEPKAPEMRTLYDETFEPARVALSERGSTNLRTFAADMGLAVQIGYLSSWLKKHEPAPRRLKLLKHWNPPGLATRGAQ